MEKTHINLRFGSFKDVTKHYLTLRRTNDGDTHRFCPKNASNFHTEKVKIRYHTSRCSETMYNTMSTPTPGSARPQKAGANAESSIPFLG
jgi:hypothetical protein